MRLTKFKWLISLVSLVSGMAMALPVCQTLTDLEEANVDMNAQASSCLGFPLGKGSQAKVIDANGVKLTYWHCTDGFTWSPRVQIATDAKLTENGGALQTAINSALKYADPTTYVNAVITANATTSMSDPTMAQAWCNAWKTIDQDRPAPVAWVVRANGGSTSRPTYALTNGVLSTTQLSTVNIKTADGLPTACNCKVKYVNSTYTYCDVSTTPKTPTQSWTKVADIGASFNLSSASVVRYGQGTQWIYRKVVAGQAMCNSAQFQTTFNDAVARQCEVLVADPIPTTEVAACSSTLP